VVGPPFTIDVAAVGDLIPQSEAPISAYIWELGEAEENFARITAYDAATNRLTLNRDPGLAANDAVDIYLILTTVDWNAAINKALPRLFRVERVSITPVSGEPEYALAGPAPWLIAREQIEAVKIRKTDGTTLLYEEAYPAWELSLTDNQATLRLHTLPEDVTDVLFIIEGRRFYDRLAFDSDTTTCPDELVKAAVRVEALSTIWSLMGMEAAKSMFGEELGLALNELGDAKRRFLPRVTPHPIQFPAPYVGPELALRPNEFRW